MSSHFSDSRDPWYISWPCVQNVPGKNGELSPSGYSLHRGRQTLGCGPVPVREEIVTGPCGNKAKLVKVSRTTDIRNTLRLPLTTTIITMGRSILLRQSKSRSLTESVPWWLTSCNKFACAKHSLFYWGPVRKITPGWNRSAVHKRLPTPGLHPRESGAVSHRAAWVRRIRPGGMTTSPTLLGPVLVWSQQNYLRLLLIVRISVPPGAATPRLSPR